LLLALLVVPVTAAPRCQSGATIHFNLGYCVIRSSSASDIHSWGFNLNIDKAGELCVVPSTVTNATFVTSDGVCTSKDQLQTNGVSINEATCRSRRGGLISTQGLKEGDVKSLGENPTWTSLGNSMARAVEVTLGFLKQTVSITLGLIDKGQQSTASHFGLASDSVALRILKDAGIIGARSFGLNVGSQSVQFPKPGSLVLGGWDANSVDSSSFIEFPINANYKSSSRRCPLKVEITQLTVRLKRSNETSWNESNYADPGDTLIACIEPYDNLFRLPGPTVISPIKEFISKNMLGSTGDWESVFLKPTDYGSTLVNLEPGLVYHNVRAGAFNTSLRFTLKPEGSDKSLTVEIPQHEFQTPLKGLDERGLPKVDTDYTELKIFNETAPLDTSVLGKVFLSQVYLFVDYEAEKFYLAPLDPANQGTSPLPVASSCTKGLSATDKGIISVGTILGVPLLLVAGYIAFKKYWRPRRS
ncbi:hypothetical protein QBC38DRAFT_331853, partial [Podospora fimiseda]